MRVFKICIALPFCIAMHINAFQVNRSHLSSITFRSQIYRCKISIPLKSKADDQEGEGNLWKGISNLWEEIIEVSTYGPSERKMLKAQRERKRKLLEKENGEGISKLGCEDSDDDDEWVKAFTSARDKNSGAQDLDDDASEKTDYDGYALQDLLISKWGVPLDIDFQKIGGKLYCTVLPEVGFGTPLRSRHETELDYLMHLQGVIEVLHKYNNLESFIFFIETTNKRPKRGTDSVPFRLDISEENIDQII